MTKTILITGATDGIGLETAKNLAQRGHRVLLHGRNQEKLNAAQNSLTVITKDSPPAGYLADLSKMDEVENMARQIIEENETLDVLINNAGIYRAPHAITRDGLDVRFAVNTIAPYQLTKRLLPVLNPSARIINLSSAAQSPVNISALKGETRLAEEFQAYAQSKLAITMWSRYLADELRDQGISVVSVNPGSLLATKMVREGFGMPGHDISIGVDILTRAALSDEFSTATGQYFDNDAGKFGSPHPDALDQQKVREVVDTIEEYLATNT